MRCGTILSMPVKSTRRGFVTQPAMTTHTATIRSGPKAGTAHTCTCPRQGDHYVRMAAGMMDAHPKLF